MLSLFVVAESYVYMQTNKYYNHIIVPLNGLSEGIIYVKPIVRMRSEVMLLDAHLNQDLHKSVDRHVNFINHLLDAYLN